jgi:hypothetical protein
VGFRGWLMRRLVGLRRTTPPRGPLWVRRGWLARGPSRCHPALRSLRVPPLSAPGRSTALRRPVVLGLKGGEDRFWRRGVSWCRGATERLSYSVVSRGVVVPRSVFLTPWCLGASWCHGASWRRGVSGRCGATERYGAVVSRGVVAPRSVVASWCLGALWCHEERDDPRPPSSPGPLGGAGQRGCVGARGGAAQETTMRRGPSTDRARASPVAPQAVRVGGLFSKAPPTSRPNHPQSPTTRRDQRPRTLCAMRRMSARTPAAVTAPPAPEPRTMSG